jgi:taurine dioxygenase
MTRNPVPGSRCRARLELFPLTPSIGARVVIADVALLDDSGFNEIHEALVRHKLLIIENQQLSESQLRDFSRGFGELMRLPYIRPLDDYPEIIAVRKEADEIDMGVFGGDWHSDFSFLDTPPKFSILYSRIVPDVGGDTLWVNMAAAFSALDANMKAFLRGRGVVHTGAPYGVANAPPRHEQFTGSIEIDRNNPEADKETLHPAVCIHPDSEEENLFINPTYTTRFDPMSRQESAPILEQLYAHCTRPEFFCRVPWKPDMIAIWDNRSTMHYAVNDYDGYRRLLYRTTIAGTSPVGVGQVPSLSMAGC